MGNICMLRQLRPDQSVGELLSKRKFCIYLVCLRPLNQHALLVVFQNEELGVLPNSRFCWWILGHFIGKWQEREKEALGRDAIVSRLFVGALTSLTRELRGLPTASSLWLPAAFVFIFQLAWTFDGPRRWAYLVYYLCWSPYKSINIFRNAPVKPLLSTRTFGCTEAYTRVPRSWRRERTRTSELYKFYAQRPLAGRIRIRMVE